jgi:hypothetical protein
MSEFVQAVIASAAIGNFLFSIYIFDTLKEILKELRKRK